MAKGYNRDISSEERNSPGNAQGMIYNEYAGANKVVPVDGCLERFPAISEVASGSLLPFSVGMVPGVAISFFNTTTSVLFVGWQVDGGVDFSAILVDATNGIALRPQDYTTLIIPWEAVGVRASAAGVIPYNLKDDSKFTKRS